LSDSGYISNLVIFCFNLVFSQSIWVRSGACVCDSCARGSTLCWISPDPWLKTLFYQPP